MSALFIAFLAGAGVILFAIGTEQVLRREVNAKRFGAVRYRPSEDSELERISQELKKKHNRKMPMEKVVLFVLLGAVVCGGLMYIVTGKLMISFCAAFGGLGFPRLWRAFNERVQRRTLLDQIVQAIQAMNIVVKSGGGMPAALEKAIQEVDNPLKHELERTLAEINLKVPEPEAFKQLAQRLAVPEMEMLSIAATLQQEGMAVNMANVFQQIELNIRSHVAFQEEVRAITSENRMAVWIVAAVPVFTLSIMRFFAPDFIAPLFNTFIGLTALAVASALVVIGIIWALGMANTESFL